MNIGFDDIALLGPMSKNRGIGNYARGLLEGIFENDTQNEYFVLNIMEEYTWERDYAHVHTQFHYMGEGYALAQQSYKEIYGSLIRKFIRENKIDIFVITSPFDDNVDGYEREWFGNTQVFAIVYDIIPWIFRDKYLREASSREWYMSRVDLLRKCDRILAISQSVKDDLVKHIDFEAEKIEVIWGAVNDIFRKIDISDTQRENLKKRYDIVDKFILCTGGDDDRKNIDGLIKAYAGTDKKIIEEYQLVVVCKLSDESEEKYKKLARKHGVEKRIILTNFVSDKELVALYNMATLLVFPSKYEGFGLPIVEAFACGLPVVTSNNSSLGQIAEGAAIIVNPNSVSDISRGIEEALTNSDLHELALRGHEKMNIFNWSSVSRHVIDIFQNTTISKETSCSTKMSKIAIFTPLPPLKSGIADFSKDVIDELSRYYQIDIYIDDGYTPTVSFKNDVNIYNHRDFEQNRHAYDKKIYEMGNSSYHWYMHKYIKKYNGIVELHDYNLHDLIAYESRNKNDKGIYREALLEDYTDDEVCSYLKSYSNRNPDVLGKPLNGIVTNHASHIIVHSQWAAKKLFEKNIDRSISIIELYAKIMFGKEDYTKAREELSFDDEIVIGVFGIMQETKRIMPILKAFERICKNYHNVRLLCVGQVADELKEEFNRFIKDQNLSPHIDVHGYVELDEFESLMDATDICLNLRYPYHGENSGSLARLLSKRKAVIINDIGSFGEIPDDACIKISDVSTMSEVEEVDQIYKAIKLLIDDRQLREMYSENAFRYASETLDINNLIGKYRNAIESSYEHVVTEDVLCKFAKEELPKYSKEKIEMISDTFAYLLD